MRSLLALALLAMSSLGCQCVEVPEREYRCADDAACVDAGQADAGTSDAGREDAGVDAGNDAGAGDAGTDAGGPTCDGGLCRFDDGGWCTSWACVQELWTPSPMLTGSVGVRPTDLPDGVDAGDIYGWFGGVLLPDGRVLAVAHDSDQFLAFDPRTETVEVVARTLRGGRRKYAGGVLAPNGRVYVFPFFERRVLEVNVQDGGVRELGPVLGPADGGYAQHVGGTIDRHGFVWTASESPESQPLFRFEAANLTNFTLFPGAGDDGGWGGWWGMVRLPDDRLLLLPKEFDPMTRRLSPTALVIEPGAQVSAASFSRLEGYSLEDGGFGLQNGSLTPEGAVCGTPAGLVSDLLCVAPAGDGGFVPQRFPGPLGAYGFNAAFGDGRVWTTPDSTSQLARISSDGGVSQTGVPSTRYGFLGMVATPQGLVTIPSGAGTGFMIIQPGTAANGVYDVRPLPVLLSPYFNKL